MKKSLSYALSLFVFSFFISFSYSAQAVGSLEGPALHVASSLGDLEEMEELLNKGMDINVRNKLGQTPLHYASARQNLDSVEFLLDNGADVNVRDFNDDTPLHFASAGFSGVYNIEVIKSLVENGADVQAVNREGVTPLDIAEVAGNEELMEYLDGIAQAKG